MVDANKSPFYKLTKKQRKKKWIELDQQLTSVFDHCAEAESILSCTTQAKEVIELSTHMNQAMKIMVDAMNNMDLLRLKEEFDDQCRKK